MTYGLPTSTRITYGTVSLVGSTIESAVGGASNTIRPLTHPSGMSRVGGLAVDATPVERWLPVVDWEGLYEVSDRGRVRSVDRTVPGRWGLTRLRGRLLTPSMDGSRKRPHVQLCRCGTVEHHQVQDLVARAFIGPRTEGHQLCHWNDISTDNRLSNLRYGTPSDNAYDKVRNGRHNEANKTHCKRGHEFTPENTYIQPSTNGRRCLECKRITKNGTIRA